MPMHSRKNAKYLILSTSVVTVYSSRIDPHEATYDYYECTECGYREHPSDGPAVCPNCDGWMRDIAVSRE